ncbi:MAG: NAD(P)-dependent oxidoreductase [Cyanobacteria bacterium]|nr:NAD(P)-dependent oxidoreductase [Cyanobacteriota bacterium]
MQVSSTSPSHSSVSKPKVFVTGATGFVGRNFIEYLCQSASEVSVMALGRNAEKISAMAEYPVQWVLGDLLDPNTYQEALWEADFVFHIAALVGLKNGDQFYGPNAEGTRALVDALNASPKKGHLKRLVYLSSISAVDRNLTTAEELVNLPEHQPLDDSSPISPNTDYGKSKRQGEALIEASGLPYTILRPAYIYGPYPRVASSMDRVIYDVQGQKPYTRWPFTGKASAIYVKDLAEILWQMSQTPEASNQSYFVANPEPVAVQVFFKALAQGLGVPFHPRELEAQWIQKFQQRLYRNYPEDPLMRILYEPYFVCDSSPLYKVLGGVPKHSLEEGLSETLAWYRQHRGLSMKPVTAHS